MLRNNLPHELDLALKWCKAKTRFINYVYEEFIHIFADHRQRCTVTKFIIRELNKRENFDKCINWDWISNEDMEYWIYIKDWYMWFKSYNTDPNKIQELDEEWQLKLINFLNQNK